MIEVIRDVGINIFSDFLFVLLVALLVAVLFWGVVKSRLSKAQKFLGYDRQRSLKIFVAGFEHPEIVTKRVATAEEYDAALGISSALQGALVDSLVQKLVNFLGGLIGYEAVFPRPSVNIAPFEEVEEPPYEGPLILLGGPLSNQLTQYYLRENPKLRFNEETSYYEEYSPEGYQPIIPSNDVAIIEKQIDGEQIVLIVHGYGELQTVRAAEFLAENWEALYERFGEAEFAVRV